MAGKISKAAAQYVDHPDSFTGHHCGICSMFVVPGKCTLVEGDISVSGVCRYYKSRGREI